ncbi:hypothetical protein BDD12DRAFT_895452 [Trichophaea hybrida]|nr:hypothetical protein BDD12DRAFT_895452 [Trichophaea hybrida]
MARIQSDKSFTHLALQAEKGIKTAVPGGKKEISGDMDYVIGYGGAPNKLFVSSLVVVEAKRESSYGTIALECVAYMEGLRQRRMSLAPQRMSGKIYGIVSDGVRYTFMRLEGKQLLVSRQQDLITGKSFTQTALFIAPVSFKELLRRPPTEYITDSDPESLSDEEEEPTHYEVTRNSPGSPYPKLLSIRRRHDELWEHGKAE